MNEVHVVVILVMTCAVWYLVPAFWSAYICGKEADSLVLDTCFLLYLYVWKRGGEFGTGYQLFGLLTSVE
jgi:hypothetical protein